MTIVRKFAVIAVLCLFALAAIAILSWQFVQHRIAMNEKAPELVRINESANDFVFRTLNGRTEHLSAKKGNVVFVDLWGTWCIQCVAEMPTVQKLYDHYRNDPHVTFLIVSRLDSPNAVRQFARLHHYDLPFYTMNDEDIPASLQLGQFPTTFLYAPDGRIAAKHTGAANWSDQRVMTFIELLKRD